MNFKGAVFDLDGTLLDSMEVWKNIDIEFLSKRGLEVPKGYSDEILAMSFRETAEYTIARFGLQEQPDDVMHEWNQMGYRGIWASCTVKARRKGISSKIKIPWYSFGGMYCPFHKSYICLVCKIITSMNCLTLVFPLTTLAAVKIIPMLGYYVQHVWEFLLKTVWRLRIFFLQYKERKQHI